MSENLFYLRVSSIDQSLERQVVELKKQYPDINERFVFAEKVSGKNIEDRPELQKMLSNARSGDTVIVESLSRLGRRNIDILSIVEKLKEQGCRFLSLKEGIDTDNEIVSKLLLSIFGSISELERDYIRIRQAEGISIAKDKGIYQKYAGRGFSKYDQSIWDKYYPLWKQEEVTAKVFYTKLGMTASTFYRAVKRYEAKYCR